MFSSWGGQPRDPFTGKLFTSSQQPVFNAALKQRIDRWQCRISLSALAHNKTLCRYRLAARPTSEAGEGRTLGDAATIQQFLQHCGQGDSRGARGEERGVKRTHCDSGGTPQPEVEQEEGDEEDFSDINTALAYSLSKIKRILR